jgi:hypothetical protein
MESADSFKTLLEEAGFSVQQIRAQAVAETDFRPFAAILIGSDNNQALRGLAKAVDNARKPILGLGEGGYYFFGDLQLAIGAPQGWHGNKRGVRPVNPAKSPFWSFRKGRNEVEEPITLYETTDHVGIYLLKTCGRYLAPWPRGKRCPSLPVAAAGLPLCVLGFHSFTRSDDASRKGLIHRDLPLCCGFGRISC